MQSAKSKKAGKTGTKKRAVSSKSNTCEGGDDTDVSSQIGALTSYIFKTNIPSSVSAGQGDVSSAAKYDEVNMTNVPSDFINSENSSVNQTVCQIVQGERQGMFDFLITPKSSHCNQDHSNVNTTETDPISMKLKNLEEKMRNKSFSSENLKINDNIRSKMRMNMSKLVSVVSKNKDIEDNVTMSTVNNEAISSSSYKMSESEVKHVESKTTRKDKQAVAVTSTTEDSVHLENDSDRQDIGLNCYPDGEENEDCNGVSNTNSRQVVKESLSQLSVSNEDLNIDSREEIINQQIDNEHDSDLNVENREETTNQQIDNEQESELNLDNNEDTTNQQTDTEQDAGSENKDKLSVTGMESVNSAIEMIETGKEIDCNSELADVERSVLNDNTVTNIDSLNSSVEVTRTGISDLVELEEEPSRTESKDGQNKSRFKLISNSVLNSNEEIETRKSDNRTKLNNTFRFTVFNGTGSDILQNIECRIPSVSIEGATPVENEVTNNKNNDVNDDYDEILITQDDKAIIYSRSNSAKTSSKTRKKEGSEVLDKSKSPDNCERLDNVSSVTAGSSIADCTTIIKTEFDICKSEPEEINLSNVDASDERSISEDENSAECVSCDLLFNNKQELMDHIKDIHQLDVTAPIDLTEEQSDTFSTASDVKTNRSSNSLERTTDDELNDKPTDVDSRLLNDIPDTAGSYIEETDAESILEKYFSKKKVFTSKEWKLLAEVTGMSFASVQKWFQNKRAETSAMEHYTQTEKPTVNNSGLNSKTVVYLTKFYHRHQCPTDSHIKRLNKSLGVSRHRLKLWFSNMRELDKNRTHQEVTGEEDKELSSTMEGKEQASGSGLSKETKSILNQYFGKVCSPSDKLVFSIADQLGLRFIDVKNWFKANGNYNKEETSVSSIDTGQLTCGKSTISRKKPCGKATLSAVKGQHTIDKTASSGSEAKHTQKRGRPYKTKTKQLMGVSSAQLFKLNTNSRNIPCEESTSTAVKRKHMEEKAISTTEEKCSRKRGRSLKIKKKHLPENSSKQLFKMNAVVMVNNVNSNSDVHAAANECNNGNVVLRKNGTAQQIRRKCTTLDDALLPFFDKNTHPLRNEITEIGKRTGYRSGSVKTWFNNKRRQQGVCTLREYMAKHEMTQSLTKQKAEESNNFSSMSKVLPKYYNKHKYPNKPAIRKMSQETGFTFKNIKYWFLARRRKESINRATEKAQKQKFTSVARNNKAFEKSQRNTSLNKILLSHYKVNQHPNCEEMRNISKNIHHKFETVRSWYYMKRKADGVVGLKEKKNSPTFSQVLLKYYNTNKHPSANKIKDISKQTGFQFNKITNWFYYKRQQDGIRRLNQDQQLMKYRTQKFPCSAEIRNISKETGLSFEKVKWWFLKKRNEDIKSSEVNVVESENETEIIENEIYTKPKEKIGDSEQDAAIGQTLQAPRARGRPRKTVVCRLDDSIHDKHVIDNTITKPCVVSLDDISDRQKISDKQQISVDSKVETPLKKEVELKECFVNLEKLGKLLSLNSDVDNDPVSCENTSFNTQTLGKKLSLNWDDELNEVSYRSPCDSSLSKPIVKLTPIKDATLSTSVVKLTPTKDPKLSTSVVKLTPTKDPKLSTSLVKLTPTKDPKLSTSLVKLTPTKDPKLSTSVVKLTPTKECVVNLNKFTHVPSIANLKLKKYFESRPNPTNPEFELLSENLKLNINLVQLWFKNERIASKHGKQLFVVDEINCSGQEKVAKSSPKQCFYSKPITSMKETTKTSALEEREELNNIISMKGVNSRHTRGCSEQEVTMGQTVSQVTRARGRPPKIMFNKNKHVETPLNESGGITERRASILQTLLTEVNRGRQSDIMFNRNKSKLRPMETSPQDSVGVTEQETTITQNQTVKRGRSRKLMCNINNSNTRNVETSPKESVVVSEQEKTVTQTQNTGVKKKGRGRPKKRKRSKDVEEDGKNESVKNQKTDEDNIVLPVKQANKQQTLISNDSVVPPIVSIEPINIADLGAREQQGHRMAEQVENMVIIDDTDINNDETEINNDDTNIRNNDIGIRNDVRSVKVNFDMQKLKGSVLNPPSNVSDPSRIVSFGQNILESFNLDSTNLSQQQNQTLQAAQRYMPTHSQLPVIIPQDRVITVSPEVLPEMAIEPKNNPGSINSTGSVLQKLTASQLQKLEDIFEINPNPSMKEIEMVARLLDVDLVTIIQWYEITRKSPKVGALMQQQQQQYYHGPLKIENQHQPRNAPINLLHINLTSNNTNNLLNMGENSYNPSSMMSSGLLNNMGENSRCSFRMMPSVHPSGLPNVITSVLPSTNASAGRFVNSRAVHNVNSNCIPNVRPSNLPNMD